MEGLQMIALTGKVALVTGAASGIGRASAITLAEQGARVALLDLEEEKLQEVKETIMANGGECIAIKTDVSDSENIKESIETICSLWSQLHIVSINAGINGTFSSIEELSPEDWTKTIDTNLTSTFLTVKHSIPYLKAQGGSIIITSSINGNRTFSNIGMSAYSSSKAGQMAFGKMAALELSTYGIRVNVICPGAVDTNIESNTFRQEDKLKEVAIPIEYPNGNQPLAKRSAKPEEVADLIFFLASDASKHITGSEMFIDGGESLL
jgi:NAD(P)-dependent dehydrogenase (short-subunit alcohol dehydrogenase family)